MRGTCLLTKSFKLPCFSLYFSVVSFSSLVIVVLILLFLETWGGGRYPHPSEAAGFLEINRRIKKKSTEAPAKSLLCMNQPISMLPKCTQFVASFTKNVDLTKILVDGCVDKTTVSLFLFNFWIYIFLFFLPHFF